MGQGTVQTFGGYRDTRLSNIENVPNDIRILFNTYRSFVAQLCEDFSDFFNYADDTSLLSVSVTGAAVDSVVTERQTWHPPMVFDRRVTTDGIPRNSISSTDTGNGS